ncbi:MAG: tetracycline resistance MFS efflux pump, partial [Pseudomonadota bacterium]
SLAIFGMAMAAVQGGLIPLAIARCGETGTVRLGFVFALITFAILGFLENVSLALALLPLAALAAMTVPALQAIASQGTPEDAQGELQGLFASVAALAMIAAPVTMTLIFAAFTEESAAIYLPGAPFLAAFGLVLAGLILFSGKPLVIARKAV